MNYRPCWRIRVRYHLAVELVHGGQGHRVAGEVDEAVASVTSRELVLYHLKMETLVLRISYLQPSKRIFSTIKIIFYIDIDKSRAKC